MPKAWHPFRDCSIDREHKREASREDLDLGREELSLVSFWPQFEDKRSLKWNYSFFKNWPGARKGAQE